VTPADAAGGRGDGGRGDGAAARSAAPGGAAAGGTAATEVPADRASGTGSALEEGVAVELVVLGASWGGLHAVSAILAALPAACDVPILLVQHRARESEGLLAELLQHVSARPVRDVDDKEPIVSRTVYVAPPDYHLLVEAGHFSLTTDAAVRYSRPSIDVTLASAADALGARVVGVVLTGANDDGARGLRRIVDRGGQAIVQDPATAEVATMPEAARRALAGAPAARWEVAPLARVAERIAARAERVR
jgi:two-component system chemotaxis response regulator CheB